MKKREFRIRIYFEQFPPMIKKSTISQSDFEMLLDWLDQNRDNAAQKYEKIRQKLIRIFYGRGCFEAEELTDETFDRVTSKLPTIIESYTGEPALYFYGVANNVHHEWIRKQSKTKQIEFEDKIKSPETIETDVEFACLENCLEKLSDEHRRQVINYYSENKSAKIEFRKKMADELKINNATLQIRMYRIRQRLRQCISNCIAENV